MIGLDTNVLARYLAQDDARQSAAATRLIEKELSAANPGFISLVVIAELCWVLNRLYSASMDELVTMLEDLLRTPQFQIERREVVQAAIGRFKAGGNRKSGLTDALIAQIADSDGCTHTVSFDKAAVRSAGMTLLS
jgi:predicted nucleic-acid-binding protein